MDVLTIVRPSGASQLPDTDGKSFAVRVDDQEWTQARSLDDAGPDDTIFVGSRRTNPLTRASR
jgi:hypothetical protein